MASTDDMILCDLIGKEYKAVVDRLQIQDSSDPGKNGNAFLTIEKVNFFHIKGTATLFFHKGKLDNIVLSPEWNRYDLRKPNGERLSIDNASYLVYKKCHDYLVEQFGSKINDEYIPEVYEISQNHIAALYISPGRDSVSLAIKRKENWNG